MAPIPDDPTPSGPEDPSSPLDDSSDGLSVRDLVGARPGDDAFRFGTPPPFRLSDSSVPRIPFDVSGGHGLPDTFIPPEYPRDRVWLHVLLFVLTVGTTTLVGMEHYLAWRSEFKPIAPTFGWMDFVRGLWYSATILGILGAHEFGHYYACLRYRINATLPFFLPVPPPFLTGTLGAFIKIRQPIRTKKQLFDIGIAGPLAGFVVAVPALFVGTLLSNVVPLPSNPQDLMSLGEPLLFKGFTWLIWGTVPDGYSLNMHPMAFGAWFGLLATALNLFPIGQLDGGHISYAVLGPRSTYITFVGIGIALVLTYFSLSWAVWTLLTVAMLFMFGPKHPRTADEEIPLDRTRMWLAVVALIVFVLCFTPAPIQPFDLIKK